MYLGHIAVDSRNIQYLYLNCDTKVCMNMANEEMELYTNDIDLDKERLLIKAIYGSKLKDIRQLLEQGVDVTKKKVE